MRKTRLVLRNVVSEKKKQDSGTALLPSTMIYLSGRLDSADRKAGFLAGAAFAFLGYIFTVYEDVLLPFDSLKLEYVPVILALSSILLCGLAIWPKHKSGEDWVSKIFWCKYDATLIVSELTTGNHKAIEGMVVSQMLIARLIRDKNKKTKCAAIIFGAAFVTFVAIQGVYPLLVSENC